MTLQELQKTLEQKTRRMNECEDLARQKEQEARDLRAERTSLKVDIAELHQQLHNAGTQAAVNKAMADAEAAKKSAQSEAEASKKVREQNEALQAELKQQLEQLKAAQSVAKGE